MEITRFIYQDNPDYEVEFEPTGSDNVMVNATQMAKIFGKQVNEFTSNENTKAFILECLKNGNSRYLDVKNESDLVVSKQKSGTWMHRILALKFAAWIDSSFEVWVYITIDKILNQSYKEERDARVRKEHAKARMARLKMDMLEKYPEAEEYFGLETTIKQVDSEILKSVKDQVKQLSLQFSDEILNPSPS
jgi:hypothetical protein